MAKKKTKAGAPGDGKPQAPADNRGALLDAVTAKDAIAVLVLAWKDAPPHYVLKRPKLDDSVQDDFHEFAKKQATQLKDKRQLIPYDAEYTPKSHEALQAAIAPAPGANLFAGLRDFANLAWLTTDKLKRPTMYAVVVASSKGTAFFGKRMSGLTVLSGSGSHRFLWNGERFTELEDSVATFSDHFDWVYWDGAFYITDVRMFHQEFRDNATLEKSVKDNAAKILAKINIDNYDQFVERCQKNVGMASKLESVANAGIYNDPIKDLKQYGAKAQIKVKWNGDSLVFEGSSIETQWAILKLLDEDRTYGPMSNNLYDSNSKRRIA